MINIEKSQEPTSLTTYRAAGNKFDGPKFTPVVKNELRSALLKEQGYLCAYCMQPIHDNQFETKIEHWNCQVRYPQQDLVYKNLLICCKGGDGQKPDQQHCDTAKGNQDILVNPANPSHHVEEQIQYSGAGVIKSTSDNIEDAIEILNLNKKLIRQNRAGVIKSFLQYLGAKPGGRTKAELEKMLNYYEQVDSDGKLKAYCGVPRYFLRKRLKAGKRP